MEALRASRGLCMVVPSLPFLGATAFVKLHSVTCIMRCKKASQQILLASSSSSRCIKRLVTQSSSRCVWVWPHVDCASSQTFAWQKPCGTPLSRLVNELQLINTWGGESKRLLWV